MRLIDAEKLIKDVEKDFYYPEAYKKMIEAQPTAYDLDKVVENLEELRDGNYDFDCCPYRDTDISCDKCHMIRAVDIVRHGGSQV
ncbi:hypothetical protein IMSAGC020_02031 [Lachnospiraceae bacterium]|jgi:hypothetical protein|nr:hypothetical protein IMSAGC020_02031 [Lachnospiraceae bacterium]